MKDGLDKVTTGIGLRSPKEWREFMDNKSKKQRIKIIQKFNEKAPTCNFFTWKKGEINSKIYWCTKTNTFCTYGNCPKKRKNLVQKDMDNLDEITDFPKIG